MSGQASSSSSVRTLEQAEADNQRLLREGTAIQNELNALKQAMAQASQRHLASAAAAAPAVHQPRLHRAKIPQPTMFAGKVGSSLDDWFTIVEKQFDYYRDEFPSDDEKIQYATGWINSDVTKYNGSWSDRDIRCIQGRDEEAIPAEGVIAAGAQPTRHDAPNRQRRSVRRTLSEADGIHSEHGR